MSDVNAPLNCLLAMAAIKIGRYSYEKRSRDVLELETMKRATLWYHPTAVDAYDDDDDVTTSVRRLIDVLVTAQDAKCRPRTVDDVCQYQSPLNGLSDKRAMQVGLCSNFIASISSCAVYICCRTNHTTNPRQIHSKSMQRTLRLLSI